MNGFTVSATGLLLTLLLPLFVGCLAGGPDGGTAPDDPYARKRRAMVDRQIRARGVDDETVLSAMRSVPRHRFVPDSAVERAYEDHPLAIGFEQTISQPYIVARMTELAGPDPEGKVLEVGTGSGYQAAVLAECFREVFTIEIVPELGRRSTALLDSLGYDQVTVRVGDGFDGWPDEAPFDAIVVTAAPATIPPPLLQQLAVGGRLVIPVGQGVQQLVIVTRTPAGFERRTVTPVRFVPMTGKASTTD